MTILYQRSANVINWVLLFTLPLCSCNLVQRIQEAASGCILRGSVISIDVPPITLTPSRTAAERQLIGENRELEKNGWLTASSRSTPRSGAKGVEVDTARRFYREMAVLDFYEEAVGELRAVGVLGEDAAGHLSIVPEDMSPRTGRYKNRDEVDLASRIAGEVNKSRDWLYENSLKATAGRNKIDRTFFREKLRPGEWQRDERTQWKRR